ncbi:MAG: PIN domain-containing protein [Thermodesulfovibrionia bacterium]|nr:PIN domain-containing protein [Thermodesulfovibrionia bacterium]
MLKAFIDTSVILRLLVKDDDIKRKAVEKLLKGAKDKGITLYLLPVAIMETVFVLEKVYKIEKKKIKELLMAILNTPEIKNEMEDVFRKALEVYESKNVKFADAVMGYWGLEKGFSIVYTYDEKDFKRIEGLEVKKP